MRQEEMMPEKVGLRTVVREASGESVKETAKRTGLALAGEKKRGPCDPGGTAERTERDGDAERSERGAAEGQRWPNCCSLSRRFRRGRGTLHRPFSLSHTGEHPPAGLSPLQPCRPKPRARCVC